MTRYYPMCLDPVSPLTDTAVGGGMIAAMYDDGLDLFRHLYESDTYAGKVPVFIEEWGKLDADDVYERVISAGMAPCKNVWAIIDALNNDPDNAQVNALADDMLEAFRRGLWEGYQDLMFDLDVPVVHN